MRRQTKATLITLFAALGLAPAAFAQGGGGAAGPMGFAQFDRNGDGVVSEDEFDQTRAERRAARADAGAPMRGPMRGRANAPAFSDIDQNGDGELTQDELVRFHQQRMRGGMGPGSGMGPRTGLGPGMGRMGGPMTVFASFDTDNDGVLTEDEFEQGRASRIKARSQQGYPMRNLANAPSFAALDRNGDDRIDVREFMSGHRQRMRPGNLGAQQRNQQGNQQGMPQGAQSSDDG